MRREAGGVRKFSSAGACFLALEAHFFGRIAPCKLYQILATWTSHLPVQVHDAVLLFLARF
jgi:hypothetical protein